jgi:hypothetical protein
MRTWMLCTLLLAGSLFNDADACWFYPYGEDIRYSFLNPEIFAREQWRIFHYSSNSFEPDEPAGWTGYDDNIALWSAYCNGKVPMAEIREAVYGLGYFKISGDTSNLMLRYLRKTNDHDAIEYLRFAKMCESLNQFANDPWERHRQQDSASRSELIQRAIAQSERVSANRQLSRRYAFLAIRLSFYNNDLKGVRRLYGKNFGGRCLREPQAPGSRCLREPQAPGEGAQAPGEGAQAPGSKCLREPQAPGREPQAPGGGAQATGSRCLREPQAPGGGAQAPGGGAQAPGGGAQAPGGGAQAPGEGRDILDYWSLYFYMLAEQNSARASFYAAQVFMHAPDKRFAVLSSFNSNLPVETILAHATTSREKSNVYAIRAIKRYDRALNEIKAIYRLQPDHDALEILILREINKLEDWIYTPYYTYWTPSVIMNTASWSKITERHEGNIYPLLRQRVRSDREYAAALLRFLNTMDAGKFSNPTLLEAARVQLLFMSQEYTECIRQADKMLAGLKPENPLHNQIMKIRLLSLLACQPHGKATIPAEAEHIMKSNPTDHRFLFAIAREVEYLGNLPLAIAIMININLSQEEMWLAYNNDREIPQDVFWRGPIKGNSVIGYDDYFDHYFHYLDYLYSTEQLEEIVAHTGKKHSSRFMQWLYSGLDSDKGRLLDLLGTKYIRKDSLDAALRTFRMIPAAYWQEYYSPWERNNLCYLFDQDPFYQLKYTPTFIEPTETEVLNKEVVTRRLISYQERAGDPSEPDRDYYWFLVANCYYNMSYYGNSWMMRRFYRSSDDSNTGHDDDEEYYGCIRARECYGKAMEQASVMSSGRCA